ncbi:MAG: hypothetical protein LBC64_07505 [Fibromonadaceae bacterium]|jgi:5'-3' exonuclease|nr:hypothetical protein [Fibromonadaceae bacterium]
MPIKGDIKKDFQKMRDMVKNSVNLSARFLVEKGLEQIRQDSIIINKFSSPTVIPYTTKKGKKKLRYLETSEMNRSSKDRLSKNGKFTIKGKKVFNSKKFVDRLGNLLKAFTPVGTWIGNRLNTMGDSQIEIQPTNEGCKAVLKFTGEPERALNHPKGRRPFEPFKKVTNLWNSFLKKELDKVAREFK